MSAQGVTRFIEVGTGKVLTGLIKRIVEGATAISIGAPADIAAFSPRRSPDQPARRTTPLFDLTGRTALVTGASGGLGGAIARALHAQGASVALSGTRRDALEALAAELKIACTRRRAILRTPPRSKRSFQPSRRRSDRSTFSSTTPASRATTPHSHEGRGLDPFSPSI